MPTKIVQVVAMVIMGGVISFSILFMAKIKSLDKDFANNGSSVVLKTDYKNINDVQVQGVDVISAVKFKLDSMQDYRFYNSGGLELTAQNVSTKIQSGQKYTMEFIWSTVADSKKLTRINIKQV